jgi:hypothetical protein
MRMHPYCPNGAPTIPGDAKGEVTDALDDSLSAGSGAAPSIALLWAFSTPRS